MFYIYLMINNSHYFVYLSTKKHFLMEKILGHVLDWLINNIYIQIDAGHVNMNYAV